MKYEVEEKFDIALGNRSDTALTAKTLGKLCAAIVDGESPDCQWAVYIGGVECLTFERRFYIGE